MRLALPIFRFSRAEALLVLLQLQLIAYHRTGIRNHTYGQFQHRMRAQAERDAPPAHIGADLQDFALFRQKNYVDGKLHGKRMDAFARHNPQAFALLKPCVFQKSGTARRAGIGNGCAVGQLCALTRGPDAQFKIHR